MTAFFHFLAAEGPNGRFLPSDFKEFVWGTIAFAVIAFFIWTKAIPLVKTMLVDGQADAVAEATAAEQAIVEAKQRIADATAELGDADAESARIVSDADEAAKQLRVDSVARSQQLVDDMWAKAQTDVDSMKTQAVVDIAAEVAAQAVGAAEEVVKSTLDASGQNDLIDSYIAGLGASS